LALTKGVCLSMVCANCRCREVAPGKLKYCWECADMEGTIARSKRREQMKAEGVPAWQRNGWTSIEQYRLYHRDYMRTRRKHVQTSS
jgi:hypothetical protein